MWGLVPELLWVAEALTHWAEIHLMQHSRLTTHLSTSQYSRVSRGWLPWGHKVRYTSFNAMTPSPSNTVTCSGSRHASFSQACPARVFARGAIPLSSFCWGLSTAAAAHDPSTIVTSPVRGAVFAPQRHPPIVLRFGLVNGWADARSIQQCDFTCTGGRLRQQRHPSEILWLGIVNDRALVNGWADTRSIHYCDFTHGYEP